MNLERTLCKGFQELDARPLQVSKKTIKQKRGQLTEPGCNLLSLKSANIPTVDKLSVTHLSVTDFPLVQFTGSLSGLFACKSAFIGLVVPNPERC